jgi:hypothetical protein
MCVGGTATLYPIFPRSPLQAVFFVDSFVQFILAHGGGECAAYNASSPEQRCLLCELKLLRIELLDSAQQRIPVNAARINGIISAQLKKHNLGTYIGPRGTMNDASDLFVLLCDLLARAGHVAFANKCRCLVQTFRICLSCASLYVGMCCVLFVTHDTIRYLAAVHDSNYRPYCYDLIVNHWLSHLVFLSLTLQIRGVGHSVLPAWRWGRTRFLIRRKIRALYPRPCGV